MRVAFIAAECEPYAKTGGLGDVVDALARAVGRAGPASVDVYLPRYRGMAVPTGSIRSTSRLVIPDPTLPGGTNEVAIVDVAADGYRLRLVDHAPAFDREGYYGDAGGDFADNPWRFGLLCRAALEAIRRDGGTDVLHLHDWHACPAVLLREGPYRSDRALGPAATLLTIHNLAYHGWTPADRVWLLGLDRPPLGGPAGRWPDGLAAERGVDLLREGIARALLVNTVSPTFASEALQPEFGMGLDALLGERGDRFFGILNGIDGHVWDPATDRELAAPYSAAAPAGKARCRADLLARVGLDPSDDGPVLGAIGRLDPQKGFDLLAATGPAVVAGGTRLVIEASGDPAIAEPLRVLAARAPDRVAFLERFDRAMARRIYAGVDLFVMPSRFEPSGQGQMIALRYGTPPIVRRTGGLADSVVDVDENPGAGTGFVFDPPDATALVEACRRAVALRSDRRRWAALVQRGMTRDFSWEAGPARRYAEAYARALAIASGAG